MPIIAKGSSGNFEPCPAGMYQAVCVDVIDLGLCETQWGEKHKVELRWQVTEKMKDGKPFLVTQRYTLSLHEKSALRHDLQSWRGKEFTEAELEGFDLEKLVTVNCMINIMHKKGSRGGTFANVVGVVPVMRGLPALPSQDYIRIKDRTDTPEPDEQRDDVDDAMPSYQDVPETTPF